jgi:O-acetyl-ADP-ribose deacetylase (regulator of RNase III)
MTGYMSASRAIGKNALHIQIGDITELCVDGIVNAANARLILGGGVAGAIARKGGPSIQAECNQIGGTYVGGAVITNAGNLPCKKIIHAVGPMMGEGNEDEKLRNATNNSLQLAANSNLRSIAFPAISTGIFGYPMDRCAEIMLNEVIEFLKQENITLDVYFCLWDSAAYQIFTKYLETKGLQI